MSLGDREVFKQDGELLESGGQALSRTEPPT